MGLGEVILLVGGILLVNLVLWVIILSWLKKKTAASIAQLTAELKGGSDPLLKGPEPAVYRGASAGRSKVKGNGVAALTQSRLIFRPILGKPIEVPRADIASLREDKWFLRAYTGGRLHTILQLKDGSEVGFFFADPAAWAAALKP